MPLPSPQPRLQRFIGGCIAALLTAGAFAVAALLDDDASANNHLRRPRATGDVIVPPDGASTIAIITTPDGRTFAADPTTADGRRAIDEARRDGSTVRDLALPSRTPTTRPNGSRSEPGTDDVLGTVLDELADAARPDEDGTEDGGLFEIDPDLVEDLLDDPLGSLTSIVTSPPPTLTSVLDGSQTAVSSLLGELPIAIPVTTTSTTPTTSPSTTTPPKDPVCSLLVLC